MFFWQLITGNSQRLAARHREPEWMDAPDADPVLLRSSLRFIRRINILLRYTQTTLRHLDRLTHDWSPGRRLTILDVATGSGDIPRAILRWAKRRYLAVQIVGIDLHEATLLTAAGANHRSEFSLARADATNLPFADGSFDIVLTNMFLHHLDEPVVLKVLAEMDRVTKQGIVIADLLRSRRAYLWISLFTAFSNPMVKHDARVSVSGAFNESELLSLCNRAGLKYCRASRHFGHRLVLAGRKHQI
jgi:ubiquinone/menaquinone biosynthesis C-methylase UbiE